MKCGGVVVKTGGDVSDLKTCHRTNQGTAPSSNRGRSRDLVHMMMITTGGDMITAIPHAAYNENRPHLYPYIPFLAFYGNPRVPCHTFTFISRHLSNQSIVEALESDAA